MNGKLVGGAIVLSALVAGLGVYYAQVYAFYKPIDASAPSAEIRLVTIEDETPRGDPHGRVQRGRCR